MNLPPNLIPNWKPTKENYTLAREITLIWQQIDASVDLVAAVCFGAGNFEWAIPLWIVGMLSSYINSKVYMWVLEQMGKDKVKYGKRNGTKRRVKKNG